MPRIVRRPALWLTLLFVLALVPRLAAVRYNVWPHGDVLLDAAVTDALVQQGELKVPLVDIRLYPTSRFGFGYPPDQHPPLWSMLGAVARLAWPDSYEALKLVSLLAGLLLIWAVYRCGHDLFGPGPGWLAATLCALSYLLIDFSGNGSLWGLLALLYVLFVWRAACFPLTGRANILWLGVLMGLGYLTNYPAIVLPLSYVAILFARWRAGILVGAGSPALPLLLAALIALPWLALNAATFGNPFFSQPLERQVEGGGDTVVDVVVQDGELVKRYPTGRNSLALRLRNTVQNLYGNVGFLVRQSFVLLSVLAGFSLAALLALIPRLVRLQAQAAWPLVILTLAHGALILLWPTTKFRYLVPLLPLAALLGSWLIFQLQPPDLRLLLVGVVIAASAFSSLWTWASIPTHTYYYDGGVVTDNFGAQGEISYMDELRHLQQAGAAIRAAGPGTVLGPHPLYSFARQPLVINSGSYDAAVTRHLLQQYDVRYVVAELARLPFYQGLAPGQVLWQDERFMVYSLQSS
jgi:4-amino-4-deoxy-L-arabinose transferase-like glycosyltransferase